MPQGQEPSGPDARSGPERKPSERPTWFRAGEVQDADGFLADVVLREILPADALLPGVRPVLILPHQGDDFVHAASWGAIVIIERDWGHDILSASCSGAAEGEDELPRYLILFGIGIEPTDVESAPFGLRHRRTGESLRVLDDCWRMAYYEATRMLPRPIKSAPEQADALVFVQALERLRGGVQALFEDAPDYGSVDITAAVALNDARGGLARGKELIAPWGGNVLVLGLDTAFRVAARDIPVPVCEALARSTPAPDRPIPACTPRATLTWTFR